MLVIAEKEVNRGLLELTLEEVKRVIERLVADLVYI